VIVIQTKETKVQNKNIFSNLQGSVSWKGHTDFAFAEDGIIIVHSKRNFPAAADILLFW
jgi:transcriptional/translational regulatory protein YebC/TACO1